VCLIERPDAAAAVVCNVCVCVCVSDLSGVSALSAVSTALLQSRGSAPHAAGETKLHNITLISNTHAHSHTHTHTHAHTHAHTYVCFCEKWGHPIGVMFFILYKLYVLHTHILTHTTTHTLTHIHTLTYSLSHTHTHTLTHTTTHTH